MPSFGQNLSALKHDKVRLINQQIGELRTRYITAIPGQELLYQAKLEEARQYLAASPEPSSLADYPLISSEVGITAPTAYQVAMVIMQLAHYWTILVAQMETLRLGSIRAVEAAQSKPQIDYAYAEFKGVLNGYSS